jgi:hypothetical protein
MPGREPDAAEYQDLPVEREPAIGGSVLGNHVKKKSVKRSRRQPIALGWSRVTVQRPYG